jgi:peptidoglycan/LPS O-acetylase OafA/YrhL
LQRRYEELDAIRGVASLTVLIHHCLLVFPILYSAHFHKDISNTVIRIFSQSPFHVIWAGHEAVILFFVLSGFVLSLPFLNNTFPKYQDYLIKRVCRIYIPYIVVIFVSAILFTVFQQLGYLENSSPSTSDWFNQMWSESLDLKMILSFVFMLGYGTHNLDTATWSLVHEMRISLFFPLIMILVLKFDWKKSLTIGLGAVFFLWASLLFLSQRVAVESLSFLLTSFGHTFYYSGFFIIGALFAKHRNELGNTYSKLNSSFKTLIYISILVCYTIEWNVPLIGYLKYNGSSYTRVFFNTLIDYIIALSVLVLFLVILNSNGLKKVLKSSSLIYLGKISYSLYLIHPVVLLTVVHTMKDFIHLPFLIFTVIVISIAISGVMYKFLELPSIELGKKLIKSKQQSGQSIQF